jgi:hypothetical protein
VADASLNKIHHNNPLPPKDRTNPLESKPQTSSAPLSDGKKCSQPTCKNTESAEKKFNVCGNCKKAGVLTAYCSRECQQLHWKNGHKQVCFGQNSPAKDLK